MSDDERNLFEQIIAGVFAALTAHEEWGHLTSGKADQWHQDALRALDLANRGEGE